MQIPELFRKPETPAAKIDRLKKELAKLKAVSDTLGLNILTGDAIAPYISTTKKQVKLHETDEKIAELKRQIQELETMYLL
jgi:polyhydroxyalkanoate synthesis regulator phasin